MRIDLDIEAEVISGMEKGGLRTYIFLKNKELNRVVNYYKIGNPLLERVSYFKCPVAERFRTNCY